MKLLVINMERERDRRAKTRERFAAVGLDPEIFPAVDGMALTAEQCAIVDNETRILRTPYEEDDAAPSLRLPEALAAIERLGPRFDFVRLHHGRQPLRVAPCADIGGFVLGRPRFHDTGMQGYVVSRAGSRRALALRDKWLFEIDLELSRWWDHGIDYFSLDPPVVRHDDDGYSTILALQHGLDARLPGARSPVWYARRRAFWIRDSLAKRVKFSAWVADGRRRLTDSQDR